MFAENKRTKLRHCGPDSPIISITVSARHQIIANALGMGSFDISSLYQLRAAFWDAASVINNR